MAEHTDTTEIEEWRDIPGFEGLYQASSLGRIKSLTRQTQGRRAGPVTVPERILKPYVDRKGYHRLNPCRIGGGKVGASVHRLVCSTFHGPAPEGKEVAHWDGDPTNNRSDNLRWATHLENALDKFRHGTNTSNGHIVSSVLTKEDVRAIRRIYSDVVNGLAEKYGVSRKAIVKAALSRSWRHVN